MATITKAVATLMWPDGLGPIHAHDALLLTRDEGGFQDDGPCQCRHTITPTRRTRL